MKKKTKVEEESSKETSPEEMEKETQEIEALKNQNFSLQELHNLKDKAYYRVQVLNSLNRIVLAIENLELGEEDSEEESDEAKESEE